MSEHQRESTLPSLKLNIRLAEATGAQAAAWRSLWLLLLAPPQGAALLGDTTACTETDSTMCDSRFKFDGNEYMVGDGGMVEICDRKEPGQPGQPQQMPLPHSPGTPAKESPEVEVDGDLPF